MARYRIEYQSRGGDWSHMTVDAENRLEANNKVRACEFVTDIGKISQIADPAKRKPRRRSAMDIAADACGLVKVRVNGKTFYE